MSFSREFSNTSLIIVHLYLFKCKIVLVSFGYIPQNACLTIKKFIKNTYHLSLCTYTCSVAFCALNMLHQLSSMVLIAI